TLERLAEAVDADSEKTLVYRRLAVEWEERDGGLDHAAEALERVLSYDARDPEALASLERVYRKAGRWENVVSILRKRILGTPDTATRRDISSAIANVLEV